MLDSLTSLVPSPSGVAAELVRTSRGLAAEIGGLILSMARTTMALAAPVLIASLWVWSAGAAATTYAVEWAGGALLGWNVDLWLARATILVSAGGMTVTLTPLCVGLYFLLGYLQQQTENTALGRGIKAVLDQEAASATGRGAVMRPGRAGAPPP